MSTVLSERYRCAADSLEIGSAETLSSEPGYFRFDTAVCFGRLAFGTPSPVTSPELIDARAGVRHLDGRVCLPFDLSEVVTNLRQERYALASTGHLQRFADSKMARDLYRYIRPALPTGVRKHLQRAGLNVWNRIPFPRWPVDVTVETLLEQALVLSLKASGRNRIPFVWFWPEGAPACAMMTHDVESREGRDFCDQLMDLDEAHGMPASFQVVPEARYDVPERFLTSLRRRGFEVNVHDLDHDGRLFDSRTEFVRRAARINDYVKAFGSRGFRAGVMYRNQEWFDHLDVSYDMSVPNVAHLEPQRGGCCTVFPYFVGKILRIQTTCSRRLPDVCTTNCCPISIGFATNVACGLRCRAMSTGGGEIEVKWNSCRAGTDGMFAAPRVSARASPLPASAVTESPMRSRLNRFTESQ